MLNEIPVRPVVLIGGDEQQQQPIDNIQGMPPPWYIYTCL